MLFDANVGDIVGQFAPVVTTDTSLDVTAAEIDGRISGGIRVIALSSTLYIFIWQSTARTTLNIIAGTLATNGVWTFGSISTQSKANNYQFNARRVSATKFIVSVLTATTNLRLIAYTVSGTTLTQDATLNITVNSNATVNAGLHIFSATRGCVAYDGGGGAHTFFGITIGTGTLTRDGSGVNGSAATLTGVARPDFLPIDSTRAICFYGLSSSDTESCIITDSGSPLTISDSKTAGFVNSSGDRMLELAGDSSQSRLIGVRAYDDGVASTIITGTYTTSAVTWDRSGSSYSYAPPVVPTGLTFLRTIGNSSYFLASTSSSAKTNRVGVILIEYNAVRGLCRSSFPFALSSSIGNYSSGTDIVGVTSNRCVLAYFSNTSLPQVAVLDF